MAVTARKSSVKSKRGAAVHRCGFTAAWRSWGPISEIKFEKEKKSREAKNAVRSLARSPAQIASRSHSSRPVPVPTHALDRDASQTGYQRLGLNHIAVRSLSSLISPHMLSLCEALRCCQLSVSPPPHLRREREPPRGLAGCV